VIYLYKNRILNNRNNMKNKNLLAENMLRFRAKNLSETAKRKIVKLAEIITEQGVSPEDVEQGKKMDWNVGYRKGDVIQNIAPNSPRPIGDFELVSSNLFVKPSKTPGNKPTVFGQVILKQMNTGEQSEIRITGGRAPRLQYIGKDELVKQAIAGFNANQLKNSEFLNTLKANYLTRV
jgi:hypothetical protein